MGFKIKKGRLTLTTIAGYHQRKKYLKQLKELPKKAKSKNKITKLGLIAAKKVSNVKI